MIIIGGGLAGLSAALALSGRGMNVALFERSRFLGGRASSYLVAHRGMVVDRGQHVLLGCCHTLLDFYKQIGASDYISFPDALFIAGKKRTQNLHASKLPAPLHLLPSLIHLDSLSASDKLNAGRLIRKARMRIEPDISASAWLAESGQSKDAIEGFWSPILTGALNETLDRASANYAAMVIHLAMLESRTGFRMGIPRVPLGVLHDELPRRILEGNGAAINVGEQVEEILCREGRVWGVRLCDGRSMQSDYVVCAVDSPSQLVPAEWTQNSTSSPAELVSERVPIATLYLWFSDEVNVPNALCMPDGCFQWCINRSHFSPVFPGTKTSLALVASAARDIISLPSAEICSVGMKELRHVLGEIPVLADFLVARHKYATFSPLVGCDAVRPSQVTMIENLYLAGDWTDTGWPGTMEGAVRSGRLCAERILEREGVGNYEGSVV